MQVFCSQLGYVEEPCTGLYAVAPSALYSVLYVQSPPEFNTAAANMPSSLHPKVPNGTRDASTVRQRQALSPVIYGRAQCAAKQAAAEGRTCLLLLYSIYVLISMCSLLAETAGAMRQSVRCSSALSWRLGRLRASGSGTLKSAKFLSTPPTSIRQGSVGGCLATHVKFFVVACIAYTSYSDWDYNT